MFFLFWNLKIGLNNIHFKLNQIWITLNVKLINKEVISKCFPIKRCNRNAILDWQGKYFNASIVGLYHTCKNIYLCRGFATCCRCLWFKFLDLFWAQLNFWGPFIRFWKQVGNSKINHLAANLKCICDKGWSKMAHGKWAPGMFRERGALSTRWGYVNQVL